MGKHKHTRNTKCDNVTNETTFNYKTHSCLVRNEDFVLYHPFDELNTLMYYKMIISINYHQEM